MECLLCARVWESSAVILTGERRGFACSWPRMGVGGGPGTNGIPALVLGTPGAPACLFLPMDPLFPSPEPCFGPGERCFLRQLWLWPLQLEHPGGSGKRNQVMGWGLGPVVRI